MTKDARFMNEIKSSIVTTKAAFYKASPWLELGGNLRKELVKCLILYHSFVWCGNLDSSESRSELLRTFWNVVLQKDRCYHLGWSFKKWRCITKNRGEQEHRTTIKQKKPNWTRHQWIIICCVTNTFNTGDFFINFVVKNTKMKQSPLSLIHLKI